MPTGYAFGTRVFTDGSARTVYLDLAGRQYVLDDNGRHVYGTWLPPLPAGPDGKAQGRAWCMPSGASTWDGVRSG